MYPYVPPANTLSRIAFLAAIGTDSKPPGWWWAPVVIFSSGVSFVTEVFSPLRTLDLWRWDDFPNISHIFSMSVSDYGANLAARQVMDLKGPIPEQGLRGVCICDVQTDGAPEPAAETGGEPPPQPVKRALKISLSKLGRFQTEVLGILLRRNLGVDIREVHIVGTGFEDVSNFKSLFSKCDGLWSCLPHVDTVRLEGFCRDDLPDDVSSKCRQTLEQIEAIIINGRRHEPRLKLPVEEEPIIAPFPFPGPVIDERILPPVLLDWVARTLHQILHQPMDHIIWSIQSQWNDPTASVRPICFRLVVDAFEESHISGAKEYINNIRNIEKLTIVWRLRVDRRAFTQFVLDLVPLCPDLRWLDLMECGELAADFPAVQNIKLITWENRESQLGTAFLDILRNREDWSKEQRREVILIKQSTRDQRGEDPLPRHSAIRASKQSYTDPEGDGESLSTHRFWKPSGCGVAWQVEVKANQKVDITSALTQAAPKCKIGAELLRRGALRIQGVAASQLSALASEIEQNVESLRSVTILSIEQGEFAEAEPDALEESIRRIAQTIESLNYIVFSSLLPKRFLIRFGSQYLGRFENRVLLIAGAGGYGRGAQAPIIESQMRKEWKQGILEVDLFNQVRSKTDLMELFYPPQSWSIELRAKCLSNNWEEGFSQELQHFSNRSRNVERSVLELNGMKFDQSSSSLASFVDKMVEDKREIQCQTLTLSYFEGVELKLLQRLRSNCMPNLRFIHFRAEVSTDLQEGFHDNFIVLSEGGEGLVENVNRVGALFLKHGLSTGQIEKSVSLIAPHLVRHLQGQAVDHRVALRNKREALFNYPNEEKVRKLVTDLVIPHPNLCTIDMMGYTSCDLTLLRSFARELPQRGEGQEVHLSLGDWERWPKVATPDARKQLLDTLGEMVQKGYTSLDFRPGDPTRRGSYNFRSFVDIPVERGDEETLVPLCQIVCSELQTLLEDVEPERCWKVRFALGDYRVRSKQLGSPVRSKNEVTSWYSFPDPSSQPVMVEGLFQRYMGADGKIASRVEIIDSHGVTHRPDPAQPEGEEHE